MQTDSGLKVMRRLLLVMAASLFISGCEATLKFIDRDSGAVYLGMTGSTASKTGEMTASIEGVDYTGEWIYSPSGGGYTLGTANATAYGTGGAATAFGTSYGVTESASGNGLITMWGPNQEYVRCVFTFNSWSDTGIGECIRNDGKYFDLTIKK